MRTLVLCFLFLASAALFGQTPYVVKDINTVYSNETESSEPGQFMRFGTKIFFVATLEATGTELWSTDGTAAGTAMVADIVPGSASSLPNAMRVINGTFLFSARDANHGFEWWTTDGTAAGTHLLLDLNPGPSSSQPSSPILYGNRLLFNGDDGTTGRELWATDGTVAGTRLVKDLNPGIASSAPFAFKEFGGTVFFAAFGGLWKSDGTESGTVKLTPPVAPVGVRNLRVAGSQLFFEGFTSAAGWEMWVSDGSDAGTHLVTDAFPGTKGALEDNRNLFGLTALGDRVLYLAKDATHGHELWVSDGTAGGTRILRDLTPGFLGTWDNSFVHMAAFGERAYFGATDESHGRELWVTDGTESGTTLFADLAPGTENSFPNFLVVSGEKLYFQAGFTALQGTRLWVSDGTLSGTRVLNGMEPSGFGVRSSPTSIDGRVYFTGSTRINGEEPWVSDGTDAGSRMIANLAVDRAPSSRPSMLTATSNLLFFYATEGVLAASNIAERSLWRSDGTGAGTFKLRESGQHPVPLQAAGPFVFFNTPVNISTALMSDGTLEGTKSTADFMKRFGTSTTEALFPFGDTLFAAVNDRSSNSLWKTTAVENAPATRLGGYDPFGLIEVAGQYMFYSRGLNGVYSFSLWSTDGTAAGTHAFVPDAGDTDSPEVTSLVNAGGTVFFLKDLRNENAKLWKTDGTLDGTVVVKEVPEASISRSEVVAAGRRLFFLVGRDALWTSDGTESGTFELTKVNFGFYSANLTPVGNRIVFTSYDEANGYGLWTSDGTREGTKFLLHNGPESQPVRLSVDGIVYFPGADDQHGTELWTTDGTPEGTKLLFDLNPGVGSSNPAELAKVGDKLYFSAYTDATGTELWALPLTDSQLTIVDTRAVEGDASTSLARFTVSLNTPAKGAVAVDYATSDGTGRAGEDYDATSGTLTFGPGETTRTIEVNVRSDASPENNETFFMTLRNAHGTHIARELGAAIIEDNDQIADLKIVPEFTSSGLRLDDSVLVSNAGPRSATDIVVTTTTTPISQRCSVCPIPQLTVGASANAAYNRSANYQQVYLSATATSRQRDLQTSDNTTTWTLGPGGVLAMNAAYLTPGKTATVTAASHLNSPVVTTSDPTVVSVGTIRKIGTELYELDVTALKPGTSLVSIIDGIHPTNALTVTVTAGTTPQWPGGVTLILPSATQRFNQVVVATIEISGKAPITGASATGTVIVTSGGHELARTAVIGTGIIKLPFYPPSLGTVSCHVQYGGDASFQSVSKDATLAVFKGLTTMTGFLRPTPGPSGTFTLKIIANGSPVSAPTGILSIVDGTQELARVSLAPSGPGTSSAEVVLASIPSSRTVIVNYLGDSLYEPASQQFRSADSHRRSVHH